jgi:hypothetical protein
MTKTLFFNPVFTSIQPWTNFFFTVTWTSSLLFYSIILIDWLYRNRNMQLCFIHFWLLNCPTSWKELIAEDECHEIWSLLKQVMNNEQQGRRTPPVTKLLLTCCSNNICGLLDDNFVERCNFVSRLQGASYNRKCTAIQEKGKRTREFIHPMMKYKDVDDAYT